MIATKKNRVNADSIGLEHINALRRKKEHKIEIDQGMPPKSRSFS